MTVHEIKAKIDAGESVKIPAAYAQTFMLECERHKVSCHCNIVVDGKCCTISPPERATDE